MKSAIFETKIDEIVYNTNDAGTAFSSISQNPTFAWVKFILTDDKANANKQRVPKDEFANIVKTGIFAPVKQAFNEIAEDHDNAFPLGVVTQLKENESNTEGIAALWAREREDDIKALKEMYASGKLPQLSWEMLYEESTVDENGIEDLHGCTLRAITIVGMPAYEGRTPIFAMASKNQNSEEMTVELEQALAKIKELEDSLAAKDKELADKLAEFQTLTTEASELRQYKETVENEKAASVKFENIKKKFADANLNKDETYFTEKKDFLLGLDEQALDFMIQELVSFASSNQSNASDKNDKNKIPNLQNTDSGLEKDPAKLAEALRERLTKK